MPQHPSWKDRNLQQQKRRASSEVHPLDGPKFQKLKLDKMKPHAQQPPVQTPLAPNPPDTESSAWEYLRCLESRLASLEKSHLKGPSEDIEVAIEALEARLSRLEYGFDNPSSGVRPSYPRLVSGIQRTGRVMWEFGVFAMHPTKRPG